MDYRQISVRIPLDLMERIEQLAKRNRCSINQMIVWLIPQGVETFLLKEEYDRLKEKERDRYVNSRLLNLKDDNFEINQETGSG